MREEVERFDALSKAGGIYEVVAYQEQVPFRSMSSGTRALGGRIEYYLSDGSAVSPIGNDDNEFEIVMTEERIWRVR